MSDTPKSNNLASAGRMRRLVQRWGDAQLLTQKYVDEHSLIMDEIGKAMKAEREQKNVTIRDLAERIGCSKSLLHDMETGRRAYLMEWGIKAFNALNSNSTTPS